MPSEITKGWTVDESSERIISKGKELSANPGKISIKLTFIPIGGFLVPHLQIKEPGSAAKVVELDGKIPPSTGALLKKNK